MYKTVDGDTWDFIAKKVYGNEMYTDYLMSNNLKLLDIFIFGAGVEVNTPALKKEKTVDLPPWR